MDPVCLLKKTFHFSADWLALLLGYWFMFMGQRKNEHNNELKSITNFYSGYSEFLQCPTWKSAYTEHSFTNKANHFLVSS